MPARVVTVVAAALVDDVDRPRRLLAARRYKPTSLSGRWEFPGGKVDGDESPEAALHRELAEELGIEARLGAEFPAPDGRAWRISAQYELRLWLAEVVHGEPAPLVEHDELRWLGPGEWLSVPWLDADVRIVEHLVARTGAQAGTEAPGLR